MLMSPMKMYAYKMHWIEIQFIAEMCSLKVKHHFYRLKAIQQSIFNLIHTKILCQFHQHSQYQSRATSAVLKIFNAFYAGP